MRNVSFRIPVSRSTAPIPMSPPCFIDLPGD
jgi:hypothetical protein